MTGIDSRAFLVELPDFIASPVVVASMNENSSRPTPSDKSSVGSETILEASVQRGPRHGFPLSDLHLEVRSAVSDGDTSPAAVALAAEAFVRHLGRVAAPELLQPIMGLEVAAPEDKVGAVLSDLTVSRGAAIRGVAVVGGGKLGARHVVSCDAPLAKLLGYATDIRSLTSGEGAFSMEYSHHAPLSELPPEDACRAPQQSEIDK